jgi:uncharacterized protein involved in copper resistance
MASGASPAWAADWDPFDGAPQPPTPSPSPPAPSTTPTTVSTPSPTVAAGVRTPVAPPQQQQRLPIAIATPIPHHPAPHHLAAPPAKPTLAAPPSKIQSTSPPSSVTASVVAVPPAKGNKENVKELFASFDWDSTPAEIKSTKSNPVGMHALLNNTIVMLSYQYNIEWM